MRSSKKVKYSPEKTVREYADQVIPIRWQIDSFHQIDWEIINAVSPNGQISDPFNTVIAKGE